MLPSSFCAPLKQSADIPPHDPEFDNLPNPSPDDDSDGEEGVEVNKDDLFAIIDVDDDIDPSSELWESPGVKAVVRRLNNLARINPGRFKESLQKPIA